MSLVPVKLCGWYMYGVVEVLWMSIISGTGASEDVRDTSCSLAANAVHSRVRKPRLCTNMAYKVASGCTQQQAIVGQD